MDNILDVLYDCSKKRLLFDKEVVEKILHELICINSLDFIDETIIDNKIHIVDLKNTTLGYFEQDIIKIYYSILMNYIDSNYHLTDFKDESNLLISDCYFRDNLYILYIIFHEVEHAIDFKNYMDDDNESIRKILFGTEYYYFRNIGYNNNLSYLHDYYFGDRCTLFSEIIYYLYNNKENRKYMKNYYISFMERMANIGAYKKILLMIDKIKKDYSKVYELQNKILESTRYSDYYENKPGPTETMFSNIGMLSELRRINTDSLSLDERIDFGLSLNEEEMSLVLNKKKQLNECIKKEN